MCEFIAGKSVAVRWEAVRRQNHWFDALYNACDAGALCGVRLVEESRPIATQASPQQAPRPSHHDNGDAWRVQL